MGLWKWGRDALLCVSLSLQRKTVEKPLQGMQRGAKTNRMCEDRSAHSVVVVCCFEYWNSGIVYAVFLL